MKTASPKLKPKPRETVIKTVSIPEDLYVRAEEKISRDPELDFSKYIRVLLRRDLFPQKP
jgi:hypothetical protein